MPIIYSRMYICHQGKLLPFSRLRIFRPGGLIRGWHYAVLKDGILYYSGNKGGGGSPIGRFSPLFDKTFS